MLNSTNPPLLVQKTFSVPPPSQGNVSPWVAPEGGVYVQRVRNSVAKTKTFAWDGDYTRLGVNPALAELLTWLDKDPSTWAWAHKGYRAWGCENPRCEVNRVYIPMVNCGTFHPWTSFKHVSRCEAQVLDQLEFLEKHSPVDYISHVVLTAPGWVSDGLLDKNTLKRFRKAVHRFLNLLVKRLFPRRADGRLAVWFGVHVWSSERPLNKHLHAHLLLPNVVLNRKEQKFYRFAPLLPEKEVKECWRAALGEAGLWDSNLPSGDLPDVGLKFYRLRVLPRALMEMVEKKAWAIWREVEPTEPDGPPPQYVVADVLKEIPRSEFTELNPLVKEKIRYCFRFPLVDLNKHLTADMLAGCDERWTEFLINYTTRRFRAGFLNSLKQFGYICRNSRNARCPFCGFEMTKLGWIKSNLPDIPHLIRDKGGGWCEVEPPFAPIEGQPDISVSDIVFIPSARARPRPSPRVDPDYVKHLVRSNSE